MSEFVNMVKSGKQPGEVIGELVVSGETPWDDFSSDQVEALGTLFPGVNIGQVLEDMGSYVRMDDQEIQGLDLTLVDIIADIAMYQEKAKGRKQ